MKKLLTGVLLLSASSAFFSCDAGLCSDTCSLALNGICEDGGSGSSSSTCTYGTDCADCGTR